MKTSKSSNPSDVVHNNIASPIPIQQALHSSPPVPYIYLVLYPISTFIYTPYLPFLYPISTWCYTPYLPSYILNIYLVLYPISTSFYTLYLPPSIPHIYLVLIRNSECLKRKAVMVTPLALVVPVSPASSRCPLVPTPWRSPRELR